MDSDDHPLAGLTPDAIIRHLIDKYLVPNWRIRDQVAEQMSLLEGRKTVAVHIQGLWLLNRPERVVVSDYLLGIADLLAWIPDDHPLAGLTPDAIIRHLIDKYLVPNWRIRDQVAEQMSLLEGRKTVAVHIQGADKIDALHKLEAVNGNVPPPVEIGSAGIAC